MAVIKSLGITAPEGAKLVYHDANVVDGTLLLHDFSNTGTLDGFNVASNAIVRDLARLSALKYGVDNRGYIQGDGVLTPGKGFSAENYIAGEAGMGVVIPSDILEYLASNQPNSVWWFYLRIGPSNAGGTLITTEDGGDYGVLDVRLTVSTSILGITPTFAGGNSQNLSNVLLGDNLIQIAMEFQGVGQPVKMYVNGQFYGNANNATGFSGGDSIRVGKPIQSTNGADIGVYRYGIEDLDVSGRTAEEVVQNDWDYVNALGEFEGITKRPYVDEY